MITLEDLKRNNFVPQPTQAEKNQERKTIKEQAERLSKAGSLL